METKTVKKKKTVKKTNTQKKATPSKRKTSKAKNLKRKKGFTLIELIAVVVLLAIVSTMAILSVSSISSSVKTRQKENLLNSIKVQAKKYVEQTGVKKVNVDTLIKEGYVTTEETSPSSSQILTDPTDSSVSLNCYYYDSSSDEMKAESPVSGNNVCNQAIFSDSTLVIKYCDKNKSACSADSNFSVVPSTWLGSNNIVLKAFVASGSNVNQTFVNNNAIWTTIDAPDVYSQSATITINKTYASSTYQVRVTSDGIDYVTNQLIKIDTTKPIAYNIRPSISNPDTWTNQSQYVYGDFEDTGSGLAAYAISTATTASGVAAGEWKAISGSPLSFNLKTNSTNNAISSSGTYCVYVKDAAGNVSDCAAGQKIEVKNIDTVPPECYYENESTTWAKSRTIKWGCKDTGSGCADTTLQSKTYTETIKDDVIAEYTIKDKAGNTAKCGKTIHVYVDTTPPSVTFKISSTNVDYNSYLATYKITGKDSHSGVDSVCFSASNDVSKCKWEQNNNSDVGVTFGNTEGTGTKYTRYAFVKDKAGNVSQVKSATYTLYEYCTNVKTNANADWSACSKKCGTGKQTRAQVDAFFTTVKCEPAQRDCNTMSCCSSTKKDTSDCTSWTWSPCTRECDGGTQYQYRTCSMISTYDGSYCGESTMEKRNEGTVCNTQSCCDEGEWEYDYCSDDGWEIESRYNGCKKKWEHRETNYKCKSEETCTQGRCPSNTINADYRDMEYDVECYYYYGGVKKTSSSYTEYCDYGWRYMACESVYVGRCYGNSSYSTCDHNYNRSLGTDEGYKGSYKTGQIAICNAEKISGDRYLCGIGWVDHIYCTSSSNEDTCLYHIADYGVSETDTTKRGNFKTASSACGS